ncbi:MAG: radical SAM protein, partial [Proteobacteria bacterium]|nr:radical SAM protein [Pseudomonadota bacterium]
MIIHLNDCWSGECPLIGPALYVWVQGCPRRCPGCCNLTAQDPDAPASKVRVEDLAAEALARPGGLVLSGGEPLLQAAELTTLCRLVREKRPDALILAYTGYTLEEVVQAARPEWFDLLKCLDVLVDGPYDQDRPSEDPLLGSSNQRV